MQPRWHTPGPKRTPRTKGRVADVVIASEAKQSRFAYACPRGGDCFVALRAPRNDSGYCHLQSNTEVVPQHVLIAFDFGRGSGKTNLALVHDVMTVADRE